jgi:hypothetical protein
VIRTAIPCILTAAVLPAQQPPPVAPAKPLQAQSFSTFTESTNKDGEKIIDIRNARYAAAGPGIPGLKPEDRLLLRISTRNREAIGEAGVRGTVILEAWPLGSDPKSKPIYNPTITGTDAYVADDAVWVVSKGLEETEWWTVLKLATTQRLFDTYVPLVHFSISRETLMWRYAGLQVPPDDTREPKLRDPHVVGVLEYASGDNLIREALITCDDAERAKLLRSFADAARTLTGPMAGAAEQSLTLAISQNFPSAPDPVTITVPVLNDDLDLAHAKLPAGLHIAAFQR